MEDTSKLDPSELGTKKYWDDFYELEKKNFEHNPEDVGESWFSDSNAEDKLVDFLNNNIDELPNVENSSIIDLGTGNGQLIFSISETDLNGNLLGIDYSKKAIEFALKLKEENYEIDNNNKIDFKQVDLFDIENNNWKPNKSYKWDIILDKGTLDAIALSDIKYKDFFKNDGSEKSGVQLYPSIVRTLLNENDGLLLITSCNFTQDELIKIILDDKDDLYVWKTIHYSSFQFGGKKGSTICSVAFRNKKNANS